MDSPTWVDDIERNAVGVKDRIALDEKRLGRWLLIGRTTRAAALVNNMTDVVSQSSYSLLHVISTFCSWTSSLSLLLHLLLPRRDGYTERVMLVKRKRVCTSIRVV